MTIVRIDPTTAEAAITVATLTVRCRKWGMM